MKTLIPAWLFLSVALTPTLSAHCDSYDGPVIGDARTALAAGKPDLVLKWVRAEDEAAIRTAFDQTLAVRRLSSEAQALADRWFFETLVRIHRAAEGAPFTGLKEHGAVDPGIEAADHALASGRIAPLLETAAQRLTEGLQVRFDRVQARANHKDDSLAAGRAFVAAYVDFIHYAEAALAAPAPADHAAPAPHGHE